MRLAAVFLLLVGMLSAAVRRAPRADSCPVQNLEPNSSVEGTLATTDCRLSDLVSNAGAAAQNYAKQYRVAVTERGALTARLKSAAFDTVLYLFTSNYSRRLAMNNDADGDTNSRITISLAPGSYILVASSRIAATGAFTLETSSEALRDCPVQELALGQNVSGTFSTTSCRVLDLKVPSTNANYVDQYRIRLPGRSVLTLNLSAAAFEPFLELYDSNNQLRADSTDYEDPSLPMPISLPPGTYKLLIGQTRPVAGEYALKGLAEAPRACPIKDIGSNDTVSGALSRDGCRFLDLLDFEIDETPVDQYRLQLSKRSVATVEMNSTVMDTVIGIADPDYKQFFAVNDDLDKDVTDSRVLVSLEPGAYIILANSWEVEGGAYTLKTIVEDPRSCPVQDLSPNGAITGNLTSNCRVLDVVFPSTIATYADAYRLTITQKSVVSIEMRSAEFEAFVRLMDSQSKWITWDPRQSSRIYISLNPGAYFVLAGAAEISTGGYLLKTSAEDPRPCPPKDIAVGDAVNGILSAAGCRVLDVVSRSRDDAPADHYRISVPRRGILTIDMTSTVMDSYLLLFDNEYRRSLENDDGGEGVNARLIVQLDAGTYYIFASTADGSLGAYGLKAEFRDDTADQ